MEWWIQGGGDRHGSQPVGLYDVGTGEVQVEDRLSAGAVQVKQPVDVPVSIRHKAPNHGELTSARARWRRGTATGRIVEAVHIEGVIPAQAAGQPKIVEDIDDELGGIECIGV